MFYTVEWGVVYISDSMKHGAKSTCLLHLSTFSAIVPSPQKMAYNSSRF